MICRIIQQQPNGRQIERKTNRMKDKPNRIQTKLKNVRMLNNTIYIHIQSTDSFNNIFRT